MKPEDVLEALRLALASGAIIAKPRFDCYPAVDLSMWTEGETLCLKWTGAELKLSPQVVDN